MPCEMQGSSKDNTNPASQNVQDLNEESNNHDLEKEYV
jgi:hypothetical protein